VWTLINRIQRVLVTWTLTELYISKACACISGGYLIQERERLKTQVAWNENNEECRVVEDDKFFALGYFAFLLSCEIIMLLWQ